MLLFSKPCCTQLLIYLFDHSPLSLKAKWLQEWPRDFKAPLHWQLLHKLSLFHIGTKILQLFWNVERNWKSCNLKKQIIDCIKCINQPCIDLSITWSVWHNQTETKPCSLSIKQQFFLQSVFAYQHQFEDPSAMNTDIKMVDLLRNLGFSNDLPGVHKHQTHQMTSRSPFYHDTEWAKWDNLAKYFTITITSSKILLSGVNSTFNLCNLNKRKCISGLFSSVYSDKSQK